MAVIMSKYACCLIAQETGVVVFLFYWLPQGKLVRDIGVHGVFLQGGISHPSMLLACFNSARGGQMLGCEIA